MPEKRVIKTKAEDELFIRHTNRKAAPKELLYYETWLKRTHSHSIKRKYRGNGERTNGPHQTALIIVQD